MTSPVTLTGMGNSVCEPAGAPTPNVYTSNDLAPTVLVHDAVYDVPTTGAASTITLPSGALDGTRVTFCADGTKNANTVTYRDANNGTPVAISAALTASKRHCAVCVKQNGAWYVAATVGP